MRGFSKVWAYVAVLLPTLIGLMLILTPEASVTPQTTAIEMAVTVGFRNLALSLVLLFVLIRKMQTVAGYFLIARGLTEIGDAAAYLYLYQQLAVSVVVAFVLGILSFVAAYFFLIDHKKTVTVSEHKT